MRGSKTGVRRERNGFLRLIALQAALCALLCAAAFALMRLRPAVFDALREEFAAATAEDLLPEAFTFFPPAGSEEPTAQTEAAPSETRPPEPEPETEETTAGQADGLAATGLSLRPARREPVQPVSGTVTSDYGSRVHPVYGTDSFHEGRDIAAAEGAPIHAVLDGTVCDVGVGEMSGNYVCIDHGGGMQTFYCHCSEVRVTEGEAVRRGDVIAAVGHTGLATGPHLHFELRIDGEKRDPAALLDGLPA